MQVWGKNSVVLALGGVDWQPVWVGDCGIGAPGPLLLGKTHAGRSSPNT